MLKRLLLLLLALLLLTACGQGSVPEATTAAQTKVAPVTTETAVTAEPTIPFAATVSMISQFEDLGVSYRQIKKPVVSIPGFADAENAANLAVDAAIAANFKRLIPSSTRLLSEGTEFFYEISDCVATLSRHSDYLSACFTVRAKIGQESAHRSLFAVTIDLKTGKTIGGAQTIADLTKLCDSIMYDRAELVDGDITVSAKELESSLFQYRVDYGIYPDLYFANDGIRVIVECVDENVGSLVYRFSYASASEIFASAFLDLYGE